VLAPLERSSPFECEEVDEFDKISGQLLHLSECLLDVRGELCAYFGRAQVSSGTEILNEHPAGMPSEDTFDTPGADQLTL
jgi:hypothetical protein